MPGTGRERFSPAVSTRACTPLFDTPVVVGGDSKPEALALALPPTARPVPPQASQEATLALTQQTPPLCDLQVSSRFYAFIIQNTEGVRHGCSVLQEPLLMFNNQVPRPSAWDLFSDTSCHQAGHCLSVPTDFQSSRNSSTNSERSFHWSQPQSNGSGVNIPGPRSVPHTQVGAHVTEGEGKAEETRRGRPEAEETRGGRARRWETCGGRARS